MRGMFRSMAAAVRAVSGLVLAGLMVLGLTLSLIASAASAEGAAALLDAPLLDTMPRLAPSYPVPAEPGQLFYIQRSLNANTVVYVAGVAASGRFDASQPVKVFWRRYNSSGRVKPLGITERTLAYGVKAVRREGSGEVYSFSVAALPERRIRLEFGEDGRPRAVGTIGGREARLAYIYLKVDGDRLMPTVASMDVFGYDMATGRPLREHVDRH